MRKTKLHFALLILTVLAGIKLAHAQTTLTTGDVAVVGINAANPDKISIVLLKTLPRTR